MIKNIRDLHLFYHNIILKIMLRNIGPNNKMKGIININKILINIFNGFPKSVNY